MISYHHAKLVLHDVNEMSSVTRHNLSEWLHAQATFIEDPKNVDKIAGIFTARYMK